MIGLFGVVLRRLGRVPHGRPKMLWAAISFAITFISIDHFAFAQADQSQQSASSPTTPVGVTKTPPRMDKNNPPRIRGQYPESMLLSKEVRCVIHAEFGPDGFIRATQVVSSSGIDEIDRACVTEMMNWQFIPATLDGKPVAKWAYLPLDWARVGQHTTGRARGPDPSLVPQIQKDYELKVGLIDYPPESRRLGQEGDCSVHVYVEADGTPRNTAVRKSTGFALLDQACIAAVNQAVFVPAKENGVAVAAWTDINIRWRLSAQ
jgi:TonB family protein